MCPEGKVHSASGRSRELDGIWCIVVAAITTVGVRLGNDTIAAEPVTDCAGRRTPVGERLTGLRSAVATMAESDGVSYTTRWFRFRGRAPELKAGAFGDSPGLVALLFPSDAGIVGVPMVGSLGIPSFVACATSSATPRSQQG